MGLELANDDHKFPRMFFARDMVVVVWCSRIDRGAEEDTTGSYIVHCSDFSPICAAHLSLALPLLTFFHFDAYHLLHVHTHTASSSVHCALVVD